MGYDDPVNKILMGGEQVLVARLLLGLDEWAGSARSSGRRAMPYVGSQLLQTHKVAPREATHGVNLSRGQFYILCLGISPFAHFSALNG